MDPEVWPGRTWRVVTTAGVPPHWSRRLTGGNGVVELGVPMNEGPWGFVWCGLKVLGTSNNYPWDNYPGTTTPGTTSPGAIDPYSAAADGPKEANCSKNP